MEHSGPGVTSSREPERTPAAADLEDVQRARNGDARAFERLYRAHQGRIHGLVRRMMGADHANEVTQDVFVRAWEKLGTFRGESAFGTWLYRLAVNVILGRRAWLGVQRGRMDTTEGALEAVAARPAGTEMSLDFESAVEHLPGGAREVFVLHDVEGYKHDEIAGMLGVTTGTTKAQLHRARMILRRHLER
jgi:RNA polymerase sigma-70 factor (ECF subfamily)